MARTTEAAVKAILLRDYDSVNEPSLEPFIEIASAHVDNLADTPQAELIERWLSAHFYVMADPVYISKSTDGVSGSFAGFTFNRYTGYSPLMESRYGRMALAIDGSGALKSGSGGTSVSGISLATKAAALSDEKLIKPPSVKASNQYLNRLYPFLYIRGTGFELTASLNTVSFNRGAIGTVIVSSPTLLLVELTTFPTTTGPLVASVTNHQGHASTIVQVAEVVNTTLVGHWPMNEGSGNTLADVTAGNDLTLQTGSGTWSVDTPGSIAGSGGCISSVALTSTYRKDSAVLLDKNASRTIAFWFKLGTNDSVQFKQGTSLYTRGAAIEQVFADADTKEGTPVDFATDNLPSINTWHHYAFEWDGTQARYFLDGVVVYEDSAIGTLKTVNGEALLTLTGNTLAKMKDLREYNSALPDAQIAALAGV